MACASLFAASACAHKKGTGYPGRALIATAGEDSLAVVDLNRFELGEPVPLPAPPSAVLPASVPGHCYVLTPQIGSVHVLNSDLRHIAGRKLADSLLQIRLTPDGRSLLALSESSRELIQLDAKSLSVIKRHRLQDHPSSMDVPPPPQAGEATKPSFVTVASRVSGSIQLFDLATGASWRASVSKQIGEVRFRFDGKLMLVADLADQVLTAYSAPELHLITELSLAMSPQNLCFNADGGQLFVSGDGMDAVAIVFPYNSLQVDQTVLAGHDPGVMACSAVPPYLFVASQSGSDVCILNVTSRKVIGLCEVGAQPRYMTVTPDNQYALILDEGSGDLAVIHISAIRTNRDKTGVGLFTILPVGQRPIHAAVIDRV